MSDHIWAREHIAVAIADGLSADEMERLDVHLRGCDECAAALREARQLSGRLTSLFAPARPSPALEDRTIATLRDGVARRAPLGWKRKLAAGLAASVGIGLAGATVDKMAGINGLSLSPSSEMLAARAAGDANSIAENLASQLRSQWAAPVDDSGSMLGGRNAAPGQAVARGEENTSTATQGARTNAAKISQSAASDGKSAVADVSNWAGYNSQFSLPIKPLPCPSDPSNPQQGYVNDPTIVALASQTSVDVAKSQGYFTTWGTCSYGINGQIALGVDQTVTDRGPGAYPSTFALPYSAAPSAPTFAYAKPSDLKPALVAADPQSVVVKGTQRLSRNGSEPPSAGENAPPPAKSSAPTNADAEPAPPRKVVIRSGEMEFEVESFEAAATTVTRLVNALSGAFVATVNSDKLPNGKVKGSIVVRVPPEHLDTLLLDVRKELSKAGELKGQRIGGQDVTKKYTDLESRLRAARTMEARLLQIIKDGKGEIKQLLEAEKELGVWRTRIEECEGELRYLGSLVALSTLTISLEEKGIHAPAAIVESERVQSGIEVDDVDKALQSAVATVAEMHGRVTKSELKQLAAGQFNATLQCEVEPAAAGSFRDRLSQLGHVARLEIDRVQKGGDNAADRGVKVTRGDTLFLVQFYNLVNVGPRETRTLVVAVPDVAAAYQTLREAAVRTRGRVLTSRLDEQDRQNVAAQLEFEVPRAEEAALQTALAALGEVVSRNVARATDTDNLTDTKVLYRAALVGAVRLKPRQTTTLAVEVPDVDAAVALLKAQLADAAGRTVDFLAARERAGRNTARLTCDVPLAQAPAVIEKLKAAGSVRAQQSVQDPQAPDGRFATARVDVTLSNTDLIVAKDDGLWPQIRRGLALSATVLLTSVTWLVFGLCVLLPWALIGYGGYRLVGRIVARSAAPVSSTPTAS
jgi:hypothetical protein